jgi:hypothetical protein
MSQGIIIQFVHSDGRRFIIIIIIIIIIEVVLFNTMRRQQTASQQQQSAADSESLCLFIHTRNAFTIRNPTSVDSQ